MSNYKQEILLKKIANLSEKIEVDNAKLRDLELELEEMEKGKIYKTVKTCGLTVEQAQEILADFAKPAELPKTLSAPINKTRNFTTENKNNLKNEEEKNEGI